MLYNNNEEKEKEKEPNPELTYLFFNLKSSTCSTERLVGKKKQ